MNFFEVIRISLLDLALHKFRSALAAIGIVFGVASVMAMISISKGAEQQTLANIARLGVDNVMVKSVKPAREDRGKQGQQSYLAIYGLTRRDLEHVRLTFPGVSSAVGLRNMRTNLYAPAGGQLDLSVIATEPEYLRITRSRIQRGRFLTAIDQSSRTMICVVGNDAARKLFLFNDPIGQKLRISGDWFTVVGILENNAALKDAGGEDLNNQIFIPLATAQSRYGDVSMRWDAGTYESICIELDQIAVQLSDSDFVEPTARRLERYLAKTHTQKDFELLIPLELMRQKEATQRIFTIVMASIASISLLIGGIGIMNIMLANVYDRRKEIGMRRALGARRRDIMHQFLIEAATLTSLGGLAGVGLGYLLAAGISRYADWPTAVMPSSIVLSLSTSCLTGLVFGLWPARQAAQVSPIEALRSDG